MHAHTSMRMTSTTAGIVATSESSNFQRPVARAVSARTSSSAERTAGRLLDYEQRTRTGGAHGRKDHFQNQRVRRLGQRGRQQRG
jgi:hypothetical protein